MGHHLANRKKKDLGVLGFRPTKRRALDFCLFFMITAFCASLGFFMRMYFGERWQLNPDFTWKLLVNGLWWNIKSVLFEELIFRGVIFYISILQDRCCEGDPDFFSCFWNLSLVFFRYYWERTADDHGFYSYRANGCIVCVWDFQNIFTLCSLRHSPRLEFYQEFCFFRREYRKRRTCAG